jgi:hypothetical protein
MQALWLTLLAMAGVAVTFVLLPVAADAYVRYRDPRLVRCPKAGCDAEIGIDAWHAAATAVPGPPRLHVAHCSLWPLNAGCGEACVAGDHVC